MMFRVLAFGVVAGFASAVAAIAPAERAYILNPGDVVRISVYQNPDLTTEVRVSEGGDISFPLLGAVRVGGLSLSRAEAIVASQLRSGNFVQNPQVNILPTDIKGSQVAVLGQVNRPGRYPLNVATTRISEMLATAGGVAATGADVVILIGARQGKTVRKHIDLKQLFVDGEVADETVERGDTLYVERAPVFYIYGQVQRPGAFRLERGMTVMQGLATGGGVTPRGTERGIRIHRRNGSGAVEEIEPALADHLRNDDVIYVRESLF